MTSKAWSIKRKTEKLHFITFSKFALWKAIKNMKKQAKSRRKCLQITYLTKNYYLEYIKNSQNSKPANDPMRIWAQTLKRHSLKKIYRWQISTWKDVHHKSAGKCKLKPQWGIIIYPSEEPKLKIVTTPKTGEDAEKLSHSYFATDNVKLQKQPSSFFLEI